MAAQETQRTVVERRGGDVGQRVQLELPHVVAEAANTIHDQIPDVQGGRLSPLERNLVARRAIDGELLGVHLRHRVLAQEIHRVVVDLQHETERALRTN